MAEERISVSRDALRADLYELKLDLLKEIDTRLRDKADAKDIIPLVSSVASLTDWRIRTERGEFTEAQKGSISRWIEHSFKTKTKESWSGWERRIVVFSLLIGLLGAIGGPITTAVIFH